MLVFILGMSLSDSHSLCLRYDYILSFHYSCFLSLILQLRLVRYAVPLVMIGCLYYKVCHFLGGYVHHSIVGLITEPSQCVQTVCDDMRKGKC